MTRARALWGAARPDQLLLITVVYALGAAIAAGLGAPLDARAVAVGLVVLLPVAASVHYANEYADVETDRMAARAGTRTPFSGGSGALVALDPARARELARSAAMTTGAVGAVAALVALLAGALPPMAAGTLAAIALLGWGYSVGPALSRRGLGEVDNALLGGVLLPHYGAAVLAPDLRTCLVAGLAATPFALVVFCNLLATQWPDRWPDAYAGKRTLPTRLAPGELRRLYLGAATLAVLALVVLTGRVLPRPVAAASLVVVPFLAYGGATYTRDERPHATVVGMVALAVAQLLAWAWVADLLPA